MNNTVLSKSQLAILQLKFKNYYMYILKHNLLHTVLEDNTIYNFFVYSGYIPKSHQLYKLSNSSNQSHKIIINYKNKLINQLYINNIEYMSPILNDIQLQIIKKNYYYLHFDKNLPRDEIKEFLLQKIIQNNSCMKWSCLGVKVRDKYLYNETKLNKLWKEIEKYDTYHNNNNNNKVNDGVDNKKKK